MITLNSQYQRKHFKKDYNRSLPSSGCLFIVQVGYPAKTAHKHTVQMLTTNESDKISLVYIKKCLYVDSL